MTAEEYCFGDHIYFVCFILLFLNQKKIERSYLRHRPIFKNFASDLYIKGVEKCQPILLYASTTSDTIRIGFLFLFSSQQRNQLPQ